MSRFPRGRTHDGRDGGFEMKLLVACCRSKRDSAADQSVLQLINAGIDWNLLLDLIDFHRVTLLVARNLSVVGLSGIPESVLERVRYSQKRTAIQNLEQSAELLRIVSLLQESGVDVIPFKGTVLARQLYGDLGLRESCDIDLIVHQQDVLAIKRILATAGYLPSTRLSPAQEAALIDSACVYELRNPNKDIDLELHWKNSKQPSLAFRPDFVWSGVQEILFGGIQIKTLMPEVLLLLLCIHGTKHCWRRLRYVCDVADLINTTENLDWTRLLRNADQLGARRMLLTGLSLAHGLLEAPVPDEILEAIRENPSAQRVSAESGRELFQGSRKEPGNWSICRFNLSSLDTWRGRIRYIAGMALRPGVRDFAAVSLPPFLFSFYRCIRLLRLMHHLTSHAQPSVGADGFKAQATHGF